MIKKTKNSGKFLERMKSLGSIQNPDLIFYVSQ